MIESFWPHITEFNLCSQEINASHQIELNNETYIHREGDDGGQPGVKIGGASYTMVFDDSQAKAPQRAEVGVHLIHEMRLMQGNLR